MRKCYGKNGMTDFYVVMLEDIVDLRGNAQVKKYLQKSCLDLSFCLKLCCEATMISNFSLSYHIFVRDLFFFFFRSKNAL